jgi:hypothetical protein
VHCGMVSTVRLWSRDYCCLSRDERSGCRDASEGKRPGALFNENFAAYLPVCQLEAEVDIKRQTGGRRLRLPLFFGRRLDFLPIQLLALDPRFRDLLRKVNRQASLTDRATAALIMFLHASNDTHIPSLS